MFIICMGVRTPRNNTNRPLASDKVACHSLYIYHAVLQRQRGFHRKTGVGFLLDSGRVDYCTVGGYAPPMRTQLNSNHYMASRPAQLGKRCHHIRGSLKTFKPGTGRRGIVSLNPSLVGVSHFVYLSLCGCVSNYARLKRYFPKTLTTFQALAPTHDSFA